MVVTGKKVGIWIGVLAILASIMMMISNLSFNKNFSYVAIGLGILSGITLVGLGSKKVK